VTPNGVFKERYRYPTLAGLLSPPGAEGERDEREWNPGGCFMLFLGHLDLDAIVIEDVIRAGQFEA